MADIAAGCDAGSLDARAVLTVEIVVAAAAVAEPVGLHGFRATKRRRGRTSSDTIDPVTLLTALDVATRLVASARVRAVGVERAAAAVAHAICAQRALAYPSARCAAIVDFTVGIEARLTHRQ